MTCNCGDCDAKVAGETDHFHLWGVTGSGGESEFLAVYLVRGLLMISDIEDEWTVNLSADQWIELSEAAASIAENMKRSAVVMGDLEEAA